MASDYGRKVARVASTGGGVTSRGTRPLGWYFVLALIFAVGIPLVWVSRAQSIDRTRPNSKDHWHTAMGWYVCNKFLPDLPDDSSTGAPIHTHGDGIIHIEPMDINPNSSTYQQDLENATGTRATLGKFVQLDSGLQLTSTSFQQPGEKTSHKNGDACSGKPAKVKVVVWKNDKAKKGTVHKGDPRKIRLRNDMLITIALVPDGANVPKPLSAVALPGLENLKNGQHTTGTTAPAKKSTPTTSKTTSATKKK